MHEGLSKLFNSDDALVNKKFIEKNIKKILVAIILLMSFIQLRYNYENHLVNIVKLEAERNDLRYTSIEKWSNLTKCNRPEMIRDRVRRSSVELIETDERPVMVK